MCKRRHRTPPSHVLGNSAVLCFDIREWWEQYTPIVLKHKRKMWWNRTLHIFMQERDGGDKDSPYCVEIQEREGSGVNRTLLSCDEDNLPSC